MSQRFFEHHSAVYREWHEKYSELIHEIFESRNPKSLLDVGANTGAVIQFIAEKHRLDNVYAFEPLHENFLLLNEFISSNFNDQFHFESHEKAIYYGTDVATAFGTGDGNTGGMFLSEVRDEYANVPTVETGAIFQCTTFEKALSHVSNIDLAKIDVEGSEWNIIEHSSFLKENVRDIILEFHWLKEEDAKKFIEMHMPQFRLVKVVSNSMWLTRID